MSEKMKDATNKWPDDVRLDMIDKSEWYENPSIYQYGYYDGYQRSSEKIEQLERELAEKDKLIEQMRVALRLANIHVYEKDAKQIIKAALEAAERTEK